MGKAAQRLGITQPVVSKTIADLEGTLGLRVFDRTATGIEPTRYGEELLARGIAIFNELRIGVCALDALSDPTSGDLRIGCTETMAGGLLSVLLDKLFRQYPRLTFEVALDSSEASDLPITDLRVKNIDLILGRLPKVVPKDIEAEVLFQDRSLVVAGSHNPLTRRRKVELSELSREPWCGHAYPWSVVEDSFRRSGIEIPTRVVRVRSILTRNGLLTTGRFLTMLPWSVLKFGPGGLSMKQVRVNLPEIRYPVGVMVLKDRAPNPATRLFIDCAREVLTGKGSAG